MFCHCIAFKWGYRISRILELFDCSFSFSYRVCIVRPFSRKKQKHFIILFTIKQCVTNMSVAKKFLKFFKKSPPQHNFRKLQIKFFNSKIIQIHIITKMRTFKPFSCFSRHSGRIFSSRILHSLRNPLRFMISL